MCISIISSRVRWLYRLCKLVLLIPSSYVIFFNSIINLVAILATLFIRFLFFMNLGDQNYRILCKVLPNQKTKFSTSTFHSECFICFINLNLTMFRKFQLWIHIYIHVCFPVLWFLAILSHRNNFFSYAAYWHLLLIRGFYPGCTCANKVITRKQALRGSKQITWITNQKEWWA